MALGISQFPADLWTRVWERARPLKELSCTQGISKHESMEQDIQAGCPDSLEMLMLWGKAEQIQPWVFMNTCPDWSTWVHQQCEGLVRH